MNVDKVSSIALTPYRQNAQDRRPAPAGERASATDATAFALDSANDALPSSLLGLTTLSRPLRPGDLVAVRVLSTRPDLQLAIEGEPVPHVAERTLPGRGGLPAAMQADQLTLRQLHLHEPNAGDLAVSLRARVFERVTAEVALRESIPPSAWPVQASQKGRVYDMPSPYLGTEHWVFPLLLTGGQRALMRVAGDEEPHRHAVAEDLASAILLLELDIPGIGRVAVRLQLAGGAHLVFMVEREEGAAHVRERLPSLSAVLALAGLRIASCRFLQLASSRVRQAPLQATSAHTLHHQLSLPLFRVAAELLFALNPPS
ncbi:hypothetical protein [Methyloversatilis thermotolerans]|uniref:hypothetical protein n=1 Tax=Methyloversatilis thermotolerans TaxID=1346290 RepID=UPI0003655DDB|nr:hypothetical protein [Methyloversatilis thermotolerans]